MKTINKHLHDMSLRATSYCMNKVLGVKKAGGIFLLTLLLHGLISKDFKLLAYGV